MMVEKKQAGHLMATESAQSQEVFCRAATQQVDASAFGETRAVYTIARGSSDAAANILSYEFMRELGVPVTSLPPSVFSIGDGVNVEGSIALVISQSGASDDLVRSAMGATRRGASVFAITNQPDSPVEKAANVTVPIDAGPELAVPATKSVIGAIGAGAAILSSLSEDYAARSEKSVASFQKSTMVHPRRDHLQSALLRARHVYVIGRGTGYGAAHEVALKIKECCALHAEAYSASEVLHGPLQLATNPLMVLILDTGAPEIQDSLNEAQSRFTAIGCDVQRVSPADVGAEDLTPAAAAALLLGQMYPVILNTALALGIDPDTPTTLSKVTQTT